MHTCIDIDGFIDEDKEFAPLGYGLHCTVYEMWMHIAVIYLCNEKKAITQDLI